MKIVVTGLRGFPGVQGGVEVHCQQLFPLIAAHGCSVEVLARKPYVKEDRYVYRGVRIIALPAPRHKTLEAFCHTFIAVIYARSRHPDIVHIQSVGPSVFAGLARLLGMRVVVTTHGSNYRHLKWNPLEKVLLRWCERLGLMCANGIIAITAHIGDEVRARYGREPAIIPNGVEIPRAATTDGALKTFGLTKGRYVLWVGRFVPEKGVTDLMEAFVSAKASGAAAGWKLVIVGKADHEDGYGRRLIQTAARDADIVLAGFQSGTPLAELYSHAGLFVLPSYYEGLPIALLEAMSYGLSCVVSDIPANREVGLPDRRYFEPGNIAALSSRITECIDKPLTDDERRRQIEKIRAAYDWNDIARRTLEVYAAVCRGR